MRKIEKQMIEAIENGENWKKDNTEVIYKPLYDYSSVYLHGNHIANVAISPIDGSLVVSVNLSTLRDYPTMITRSRLRALGADLESIKGILHLDGKSIYQE